MSHHYCPECGRVYDDCPVCDVPDKDAEIARLRFDLAQVRQELAKADAENNAAGRRAARAEIQWRQLRDRMHGLAQQWRGGRAPGPEFGHALEAAVIQLDDETKES